MQWLIYSSLYSQHKDCYKGVVFDGLESLFTSSQESSLLCILKAVKNHHHIFMVNLNNQDYDSWKAKEEAKRKRKEAKIMEKGEISPSLSNLLYQALNFISVYLGLQQSL